MKNETKTLVELNNLHKHFKNHFNDRVLEKYNLFEKMTEIQKPITDEIKKGNELQKETNNNLKSLPAPIVNNETKLMLANENKPKADNSYFALQNSPEGTKLYGIGNRVDIAISDKDLYTATIFREDGSTYQTQLTDGMKEILFERDLDYNLITEDDFENVFKIYNELQKTPGQSQRFRNLRKQFPNISKKYPEKVLKEMDKEKREKEKPKSTVEIEEIVEEKEKMDEAVKIDVKKKSKSPIRKVIDKVNPKKKGKGVEIINLTEKNPVELFQELKTLKSAKIAGNNNTFNRASAILDFLRSKKTITKTKYDLLMKFFSQ